MMIASFTKSALSLPSRYLQLSQAEMPSPGTIDMTIQYSKHNPTGRHSELPGYGSPSAEARPDLSQNSITCKESRGRIR